MKRRVFLNYGGDHLGRCFFGWAAGNQAEFRGVGQRQRHRPQYGIRLLNRRTLSCHGSTSAL